MDRLPVIISAVPEAYSRESNGFDIMAGDSVVSIQGLSNEGGELKESIGEFREHHDKVGRVLLNLTDGVDPKSIRPHVPYHAYPQMIYHPDGTFEIVNNEAEKTVLLRKGFRETPFLKPQVAVEDPATEKKRMQDENKQLRGQVNALADLIMRLEQRLNDKDEAERMAFDQDAFVDDNDGPEQLAGEVEEPKKPKFKK